MLSSYKTASKKETAELLANGLNVLKGLEEAYNKHFVYNTLSDAQEAYESDEDTLLKNQSIVQALSATRDALQVAVDHATIFEKYLLLQIPQMEDGNNFGVTVQLHVLKEVGEVKEKWMKALEDLPKYFNTRAEATEKLNMVPSQTKTETKTTSNSTSHGGKDGDEAKDSVSTNIEEKTFEHTSQPDYYRVQHVYALDVRQYATLKTSFTSVLNGYMAMLDNMDKNKTKIEAPKGTSGGNFGAMY